MADVQWSACMPSSLEYNSSCTKRFKFMTQCRQEYKSLDLSHNKPGRRKTFLRSQSLTETSSKISNTLSRTISTSITMGNLPSLDLLGVDDSFHDPKMTLGYTHPIKHGENYIGNIAIEFGKLEKEKSKNIERSMRSHSKCKELDYTTAIVTSSFPEWQSSSETTVVIDAQRNKPDEFDGDNTATELEEIDQQNASHRSNSIKLIENHEETRHDLMLSTKTSTETDPPCKQNILVESDGSSIPYTDEDLDYLNSIQESFSTDDEVFEILTPTLHSDAYCASQANVSDTSVVDGKTIQFNAIDSSSTELDELPKADLFNENMLVGKEPRNMTPDILFDEVVVPNSDVPDTDVEFNSDNLDVYSSNEENSVDLNDFKASIKGAVEKSIESNSITPIIKQELQYKIQFDRLERGEEEITIAPESPKIYKLRDDEIRKKCNRREQNRLSALRSRSKAKEYEIHLERKLNDAARKNSTLMMERNRLREKRNNMLNQLKGHLPKCQKTLLAIKQLGILAKMYAS